jgi:hypothetical protein
MLKINMLFPVQIVVNTKPMFNRLFSVLKTKTLTNSLKHKLSKTVRENNFSNENEKHPSTNIRKKYLDVSFGVLLCVQNF